MSTSTTRSAVMGAAAVAVTAVPNLGPLLRKSGEQTERYDTSITPPGYAFAVWAPIFSGIVGNAVQANLPGRRDLPDNAATGWPLSIAYGLNTAWSLAAQSDRFALTPILLPAAVAATAVAYRRLQRGTAPESITSVSTGLLLGWTSLAATVNVSAATQLLGVRATSPRSIRLSALGCAAASSVLAATVVRSRRGYLSLAAPATWGLATTAFDRRRPTLSRAVCAAAALAVAAASAARTARGGPGGRPRVK